MISKAEETRKASPRLYGARPHVYSRLRGYSKVCTTRHARFASTPNAIICCFRSCWWLFSTPSFLLLLHLKRLLPLTTSSSNAPNFQWIRQCSSRFASLVAMHFHYQSLALSWSLLRNSWQISAIFPQLNGYVSHRKACWRVRRESGRACVCPFRRIFIFQRHSEHAYQLVSRFLTRASSRQAEKNIYVGSHAKFRKNIGDMFPDD